MSERASESERGVYCTGSYYGGTADPRRPRSPVLLHGCTTSDPPSSSHSTRLAPQVPRRHHPSWSGSSGGSGRLTCPSPFCRCPPTDPPPPYPLPPTLGCSWGDQSSNDGVMLRSGGGSGVRRGKSFDTPLPWTHTSSPLDIQCRCSCSPSCASLHPILTLSLHPFPDYHSLPGHSRYRQHR